MFALAIHSLGFSPSSPPPSSALSDGCQSALQRYTFSISILIRLPKLNGNSYHSLFILISDAGIPNPDVFLSEFKLNESGFLQTKIALIMFDVLSGRSNLPLKAFLVSRAGK
ncbi:hypothetical protein ACLOJK_033818 [Asimina triloba]